LQRSIKGQIICKNNLDIEAPGDGEMVDEMINTTALFNLDDIREATKQSNFNKGLGPDCFDGNALNKNI
jgi:hypothetical protein